MHLCSTAIQWNRAATPSTPLKAAPGCHYVSLMLCLSLTFFLYYICRAGTVRDIILTPPALITGANLAVDGSYRNNCANWVVYWLFLSVVTSFYSPIVLLLNLRFN